MKKLSQQTLSHIQGVRKTHRQTLRGDWGNQNILFSLINIPQLNKIISSLEEKAYCITACRPSL